MSTLRANNLHNLAGENHLDYRPGEIIETLTSVCDGSSKTVKSGTYTFQNVTGQQGTSTAYTDISGSSMTYVPPAGTTCVTYSFQFSSYWISSHAINHYKFFINSSEVLWARHSRSSLYLEDRNSFFWTINVGGSANTNSGRLSSWTTPLNLKMQARHYSSGNNNNLHGTTYWDGAGSNQFSMPVLMIQAIA